MTTSTACSRTASASAEIFTPHGASLAPTTSPKSRPTFAGSVSIAPQISMACFSRIRRAMDAPIGPTPYWMARIFFFTGFSVFHSQQARHSAFLAAKETLTIKEFANVGNAKRDVDHPMSSVVGPGERNHEMAVRGCVAVFCSDGWDCGSRNERGSVEQRLFAQRRLSGA